MGSQDYADSRIGIVLEEVPCALEVSFQTEGSPRKLDANSLLGLRINYAVGEGYTKAIFLHERFYSPERDAAEPWGTGRPADEVVETYDMSMMRIEPVRLAPEGWNGRLILTVMMQNTGAGTRAKVRIRPLS